MSTSSAPANATKRFHIEAAPLVSLFIATDAQKRLRLSADLVDLYDLHGGNRLALGYDAKENAIAVRKADNPNDPTAANVDKRGYLSARQFYAKSRIEPVRRRYRFEAEQDGWLVFVADEE